jgi:hypothetical protein
MNREQLVQICQQCSNRNFDPEQGIICNLTGQKAAFENECSEFIQDENRKQVTLSREEIDEETSDSAKKNMIIGAIFCIVGLGATMADFGYIFWGAIVFGAIQFIRGALDLK